MKGFSRWTLLALMAQFTLVPFAHAAGKAQVVDIKAEPGGFDLPVWQRQVLKNGVVLLLMEQHEVPLVQMQLTVKAGAAADPSGKEGLASLTSQALTAGTTTRNAQQLAVDIDFVGGQLSADVGMDSTSVSANFLSKDVDRQLELLSDVVLRPAFATEEIDRLREQKLAELSAAPEDARAYAFDLFEATVFRGTPYGHPTTGFIRTVKGLTTEDVKGFYQTWYTPPNTILAVVGDFKSADMVKKIDKALGKWSGKAPPAVPSSKPEQVKGRQVVLVDYPGLTQSQIRIGGVGIARGNPDIYAIQVANVALGGGFTSRLVEEVRVNRSLSYSASSSFSIRRDPGSYTVMTFTKNETLRTTIDVVFDVLKQFREVPMPPEELRKATNYLLGQFPLNIETPEGLARMLSTLEQYGLPLDYVETFASRVKALTPDQVTAAIRQYFLYEDVYIVLFTDISQTRGQLEGLGQIEVRTPLD